MIFVREAVNVTVALAMDLKKNMSSKVRIRWYTVQKVFVFGVIQSECGEILTRITSNTDTFYAVVV